MKDSEVQLLEEEIEYERQIKQELENSLDNAFQEIEELKKENMCDSCCGTGEPISGLTCMCGGSGKASDAVYYLRQRIIKLEAELFERQYWKKEQTF